MTRHVHVHFLPDHIRQGDLAGGIAVIIDVLRASTTIVTALANGARYVIPCGDIDEAKSRAKEHRGCLLGGERGGVTIAGFDLGNSPDSYTRDVVEGKTIVFTTTNGTRALFCAGEARRILIACLANRAGLCEVLRADEGPIHLVCAGTNGRFTWEDMAAAGAIVAGLPGNDFFLHDSAAIAGDLFCLAQSSPGGLPESLRKSGGGRGLLKLGYERDIDRAAELDTFEVVPEYSHATGRIEPVRGSGGLVP